MPASKKREPKRAEEATAPEWMLTLGDCISLLLTFFVLLISFSSMNTHQLMTVMGVVQGALGAVKIEQGPDRAKESSELESGSFVQMKDLGVTDSGLISKEKVSPVQLDRIELKKQLRTKQHELATIGSPVSLTLAEVEEGLVIRLSAASLFDPESRLTPAAEEALSHIAELAANVGNEIRLIDCTVAPSEDAGALPSMSWGSRIRRARRVGRRMVEMFGFAETRFGYGARVVQADEQPAFELMLMDQIGAREVSLRDLWASAESPRG